MIEGKYHVVLFLRKVDESQDTEEPTEALQCLSVKGRSHTVIHTPSTTSTAVWHKVPKGTTCGFEMFRQFRLGTESNCGGRDTNKFAVCQEEV